MRRHRRTPAGESPGSGHLDGHAMEWGRQRWPGLLTSMRVRLTLWYGAILALILLLCSGAIYVTQQQSLRDAVNSRLAARVQQWAAAYDARSGRLNVIDDADVVQGTEVVLLLTPTGQLAQTMAAGSLSAVKIPWAHALHTMQSLARNGMPAAMDLGLQLTIASDTTKDARTPLTMTRAVRFRLTGRPLVVHGRVAALLVVGVQSGVEQQLAALARTLATIVPLTLILCAGGGYWLAARALRPIRTMTRTAQEIGATDLSRRLGLHSRDEVGQLATTIDHLLARLEAAFARERQFTADASHELRTPLAIVELEAAHALAHPRTPSEYRQAIAIMQQEAAHVTRLIDDLLTLARAESDQAARPRAEIDLAEIVLDVAAYLAPLARRSGMTIRVEELPELSVWGDQEALRRTLTNIVENALKYGAGRGTQVRLNGGLRRRNEIAGVWLQVADDGPGIATEHLPRLGQRFYRVDPARTHSSGTMGKANSRDAGSTGSGLGLAISQQIISAHCGILSIHSGVNQGVVVEIWLPTSDTREE